MAPQIEPHMPPPLRGPWRWLKQQKQLEQDGQQQQILCNSCCNANKDHPEMKRKIMTKNERQNKTYLHHWAVAKLALCVLQHQTWNCAPSGQASLPYFPQIVCNTPTAKRTMKTMPRTKMEHRNHEEDQDQSVFGNSPQRHFHPGVSWYCCTTS